jgi:putative GTP pyrophosphokinase
VTRRDRSALSARYEQRYGRLVAAASKLESELQTYLHDVPHVDRIYFRAKGIRSFVDKAMKAGKDGNWIYEYPFEQIEDQLAGRILVFYRSDVNVVVEKLVESLRKVENDHKSPKSAKEFDYETTHLVFALTPDLLVPDWTEVLEPPVTFEVQIRTLAQHAWAEPQHGFYKNSSVHSDSEVTNELELGPESQKKLYWAAASAWGIDSIWDELRLSLEERPN